jgi:serine/threonine-protein kinase
MAKEDFEKRPSDPIGRDFGSYRPIRRLGVGGMAETFEAIRVGRKGFSQRVCLKLVLPFFRDSEDFIELFEREARLAAKLRHSNIVGIIDYGEFEGTPYMALELVDGVDLQALLAGQKTKRLPHELVAFIGYHVATALEHAHNPPLGSNPTEEITAIIHRDISPSNVLLSRHGEVLLGDFGVAKAITGTTRKQSAVKGKVPYMSPEQLRAEPLDGRADLFGLGVVLFEALAGQRPYLREHDPATIVAILNGEHPSLETLAPDAPPGLCTLIESLIEPDREMRPPSATKLIELLDDFVPSPRIRRQLGAMVAKARPERPVSDTPVDVGLRSTDLQSGALEGEGTGSPASDSRSGVSRREAGESLPPPRRRRWSLAVLMMAVMAAVGLGVWETARRAEVPQEEPVLADESATAPVATGAPDEAQPDAPTGQTDRERDDRTDDVPQGASPTPVKSASSARASGPAEKEAEPREPEAAAVRPAKLSVIVYPWGRVWINGKDRGLAPLDDVVLRPGRYKVSAGQKSPLKTRVIRLKAGEKRALTMDLTK